MEENKSELIIISNDLEKSNVNEFCENMREKLVNLQVKYTDGQTMLDRLGSLKGDKALINKVAKTINDYRIAKGKEYFAPYEENIKKPLDELIKEMETISNSFKQEISDLEEKDKQVNELDIKVADIPNGEELKAKYSIVFPDAETKNKIIKYMQKYNCVVKEIKK